MKETAYDTEKIRAELQKTLKPSRYLHTLNVAVTASCLAMRYGGDTDRAYLAGLLHDCAKHLTGEEILRALEERGIPVRPVERDNASALLHSRLGACFAEEKFGITDPEILSAIAFHTTGRVNMTLLEKILFIADYIEPMRNQAERLPAIREAAFSDPDRAVRMIAEDTLAYVEGKDPGSVDPRTREVYCCYREIEKRTEKRWI